MVLDTLRARAWWVLVAFSALIAIFGITDVLIGATADVGIPIGLTGKTPAELEAESASAYRMFDFTSRSQGLILLAFGIALTAILVIPYRNGQRWSWYVAWVLPAWALGAAGLYIVVGLAPSQALPPPVVSGPIIGVVAIAVLLWDRRRFVQS